MPETELTEVDTQQLIAVFNAMADAMEQHRDHLCELDGVIGDADHGVTMSIGFTAVRQALQEVDATQSLPTDVFNTAAKSFLNAVGASAGPLYATAFMRAGASVKNLATMDTAALGNAIEAMAEGIQARGKAEAGDKTMLDAWLPAATAAAENKESGTISSLLQAVAAAADIGAEATVAMLARKGRSAKLGDRTIGHMDAGAASTAILLRALADCVSAQAAH